MSDKETTTKRWTSAALATEFVARYREEVRWDRRGRGLWLAYNGKNWEDDGTASTLYRRFLEMQVEEPSKIDNAIKILRGFSELWRNCEDFDLQHNLLNTAAGVVDLASGELYVHEARDYLRHITPYQPTDKQPRRFLEWLNFITEGDADYASYLQRAVGYSLTGETSERVLFFSHGPTTTGKSTFVHIIKSIAGSYAQTVPIDQFLRAHFQSSGAGLTPVLAALRGARLAVGTEMPRDAVLDTAFVKAVTGDTDAVKATAKYQAPIEFVPQFKTWLFGNYEPSLEGDAALFKRLRQLPFIATITATAHDFAAGLLREEGNGILTWAIQGAVEWYRQGLGRCAAVEATTQRMRRDQDGFFDWLTRHTATEAGAWTPVSQIQAAYEMTGAAHVTPQKFGRQLADYYSAMGWRREQRGDARVRGLANCRLLSAGEVQKRASELAEE